MLVYLSTDITSSQEWTVFWECSSRKTVSFEELIMSKDTWISDHIFMLNGGYCVYHPSNLLQTHAVWKLGNISNIVTIWRENMLGYLSADIKCSDKRTVYCEVRGTDKYVQEQISEHIFAPNGDYCLDYPSNLFRRTCSFKNWGIFSDIPQFWLGNIWSRDALRPITHQRKDFMDYN